MVFLAKAPSNLAKISSIMLFFSVKVIKYINGIKNTIIDIKMLSSSQIRAARALLGWSGTDLAEKSGVVSTTLRAMSCRRVFLQLIRRVVM